MSRRLINKDLRGPGDPVCAFYAYLERRELKSAPADHIVHVGFQCFSDLAHDRQRFTYKQPTRQISIRLPIVPKTRTRELHQVA